MVTTCMLRQEAFNFFVVSVLRQIAAKNKQSILFKQIMLTSSTNEQPSEHLQFDAVAPDGFEDFDKCTFFEFKKSRARTVIDEKTIEDFRKKIKKVSSDQTAVGILITDESSDKSPSRSRRFQNEIRIYVWGRETIEKWIQEYPVDYDNAINLSPQKTNSELSSGRLISKTNVKENSFERKKRRNLDAVMQAVATADNFAFVLGAGVSIPLGAKSWKDLLKQFTSELKQQNLIDNSSALSEKIGDSSLITAQLCKELYSSETNYYWAIHQGLYKGKKPFSKECSLYQIARIAASCTEKKYFRILTYNYDNYLETYLKIKGVSHNILYNEECEINDRLLIYHVHGYMPEVTSKTKILPAYRKSIFLTEQNYNDLYNHPYSWQIASQLSFFRENICLFVGCSLTDPNIRRLLEITYRPTKVHYAILTKDGMSDKDLMRASNHFARLGIEIIWADDFNEIPWLLRRLLIKKN